MFFRRQEVTEGNNILPDQLIQDALPFRYRKSGIRSRDHCRLRQESARRWVGNSCHPPGRHRACQIRVSGPGYMAALPLGQARPPRRTGHKAAQPCDPQRIGVGSCVGQGREICHDPGLGGATDRNHLVKALPRHLAQGEHARMFKENRVKPRYSQTGQRSRIWRVRSKPDLTLGRINTLAPQAFCGGASSSPVKPFSPICPRSEP